MKQRPAGSAPTWLALASTLCGVFAAITPGLAQEPVYAAPRADQWSEADKATLGSMLLSRLQPPALDLSNAVETRPEAVALGERLFFDTRLSKNGRVACGTCHDPDRGFQDGLPVGKGVGTGTRRTMPIAGVAYSPWMFWDGRKDSLWSQALGPLEDNAEHGANRAQLVRVLEAGYRTEYEGLFGRFPSLLGVPPDASPLGTAQERDAWASMSPAQRDAVNRVFANLGKAIAAYERTVTHGESHLDRYVAAVLRGDTDGQRVLTAQEVRGLRLFIGKGQCSTCHNGPLLTDQHFHNTGVPQRDASRPDRGRDAAVVKLLNDEFNCLGKYSDAPSDGCQELRFIASDDPGMAGAFKTPSLRDVARRAPYMHAGQFASLEEVVAHYVRSPAATVGHSELAQVGDGHAERSPIRLADEEVRDLVAFLKALSGPSTQVHGQAPPRHMQIQP
jgi:cytochrome c peroxidase